MQRAVRLSEIIDHRLAPVVVVVAAQFFFRLCSSRYLGSGSIATKMHRSCGLLTVWYILLDFNMAIRLWKSLVARKTGWKLWFPEFLPRVGWTWTIVSMEQKNEETKPKS